MKRKLSFLLAFLIIFTPVIQMRANAASIEDNTAPKVECWLVSDEGEKIIIDNSNLEIQSMATLSSNGQMISDVYDVVIPYSTLLKKTDQADDQSGYIRGTLTVNYYRNADTYLIYSVNIKHARSNNAYALDSGFLCYSCTNTPTQQQVVFENYTSYSYTTYTGFTSYADKNIPYFQCGATSTRTIVNSSTGSSWELFIKVDM